MLGEYYRLAKPGIIYGNVLTTIASFLFASRWHFPLPLFFSTVLGISLVIGGACVFNNYLDRDIDALMARTRTRALPSGRISPRAALAYGGALAISGFALLLFMVNALTTLLALVGFFDYVLVYTFAKRATPLSTLIGTVAGAVPIAVGYTAVTGALDATAVLLFLTLVAWQMPHFYAIAMRRGDEYRTAGLPVRPLVSGATTTKIQSVVYIALYGVAALSLGLLTETGIVYAACISLSGILWLALGIAGFVTKDEVRWAKRFFFASLAVLVVLSLALTLSPLMP